MIKTLISRVFVFPNIFPIIPLPAIAWTPQKRIRILFWGLAWNSFFGTKFNISKKSQNSYTLYEPSPHFQIPMEFSNGGHGFRVPQPSHSFYIGERKICLHEIDNSQGILNLVQGIWPYLRQQMSRSQENAKSLRSTHFQHQTGSEMLHESHGIGLGGSKRNHLSDFAANIPKIMFLHISSCFLTHIQRFWASIAANSIKNRSGSNGIGLRDQKYIKRI